MNEFCPPRIRAYCVSTLRAMWLCGLLTACSDGGGTGPGASTVTTVTVTPATATLTTVGATVQLSAVAKDQDGATMSGVAFTWSSSATGVAGVDSDGTVTAVANGTATITATANGKSGTATVTAEVAGSVRIVTGTTGESGALDPDGYTVTVDGTPRPVGVTDTLVVPNVPAGSRTVELTGVAANCAVGGANPRTVTVTAGDTVEAVFTVDCVLEVGMAYWVRDLSAGCPSLETCLGSSVALGSNGAVYVQSYAGVLHAVRPDGTSAWSYETPIAYPPAVAADGTIYVTGETDTAVHAIDATGQLVWSFDTGADVTGSTAIGADGTVYVGNRDRDLYALRSDGTLKWTHAIPESRFGVGNLAVGPDGTVYAAITDSAYGGTLVAIGADGARKWSYSTPGQMEGPAAIGGDGTIYVGGIVQTIPYAFDGNLYALHPDGTLRWSYQTQGAVASSPVIAPDGTIYVGSGGAPDDPDQTGTFYAINPDGSLQWSYPLPGCVGGGATVGADGLVYVPVAGCVFGGVGILVVLDPNGAKAWDFQVAGSFKVITGAPAIASDGTLYMVSAIEGDLYALKTSSMGLADSPWPRARHDNRNTSEATVVVP